MSEYLKENQAETGKAYMCLLHVLVHAADIFNILLAHEMLVLTEYAKPKTPDWLQSSNIFPINISFHLLVVIV